MNEWILKGPRSLVKETQEEGDPGPGQVKVKVTYAMLTAYDAQIFTGVRPVAYPRTLGRAAVGVVTDTGEGCYGLETGMRVYLSPVRACGECVACKKGRPDECTDVKTAGRDFDGFFRDIVVCDAADVLPLPDGVSDTAALFTEYVAVADRLLDNPDLDTGSKIAIVGGGFMGSVIAQTAMYHRYIPIIIDNGEDSMERARRIGVYYSFPADDELEEKILASTGGQMCDAAVYVTSCRLSPSYAAKTLSRGKTLSLAGFTSRDSSLELEELIERDIHVCAATDGYGYIRNALNMLANRAVDTDIYDRDVIPDPDIGALVAERAEKGPADRMTVMKMVM